MELPLKSPTFWLALTGLVFFTGLIAGSYPALYLSSLNPVNVLKGKQHFPGVISIRQGLVGFQFTLSVLFIIATSVVSKQTKFLQTKETGYDRSGILYILIEAGSLTRYEVFRGKALDIVNEQAIKQMGLKYPIGKSFSVYGNKGVIIGVMKDFHFNSFRQPIEPLVISIDENLNFGNILVRTQPGKTKEALTGLGNLYKNLNPEYPFTFSFLDQQYLKQYRSEQIIETITSLFSGLAIFIASLGLSGLAAITADQRTKEIGIRKVLGASVMSIVTLLSSNFLKLVMISILIASPIAWFLMRRWLQEFAYKVDIGWSIFGHTAFLALSIALVTVSYQSITAALLNPIKSLKSE
jgi:ABC-type antimicrobial peptide transport system permease subunit